MIAILIAVVLIVGGGATHASPCNDTDYRDGTCEYSGENTGDGVAVGGEGSTPGSGGNGGSDSGSNPGTGSTTPVGSNPPPTSTPPPPPGDPWRDDCPDNWCAAAGADDDDADELALPTHISELAHIRPVPGTNLMEPDGWMIVDLPTNFYAHASIHVRTGQVLGNHADVRFTPTGYLWSYGDGTTRASSTPGGTWQQLGLREFDPTPNSHTYRSPGTYYIDLSVVYRAEYRIRDITDWRGVSGTITVPANRLIAVAANGATTVLVDKDCHANPTGPGC